jgi:hypothetical protein
VYRWSFARSSTRLASFWVGHSLHSDPRFDKAKVKIERSDENVLFSVAGPSSIHLCFVRSFFRSNTQTTYQYLSADLPINLIHEDVVFVYNKPSISFPNSSVS